MINILQQPIIDYICDGCGKKVHGEFCNEELPEEEYAELPELGFCMTITADFSFANNGLSFNNKYCKSCGSIIVRDLELLFGKKVDKYES